VTADWLLMIHAPLQSTAVQCQVDINSIHRSIISHEKSKDKSETLTQAESIFSRALLILLELDAGTVHL
jgi:hypothetical protein